MTMIQHDKKNDAPRDGSDGTKVLPFPGATANGERERDVA